MHWDPGQSSDSIGAWVKPTCGSWRVSWRGEGWLWLTVGARTLVAGAPGNIHWRELSWRLSIWHQDLAPVLGCLRPNNRMGTQPQPSADRLPKVNLSPQLPIYIPLDTSLSTRGTRPSSTHQWAGTSSSHQEACTRPWTNLTHKGQTPEVRRSTILQPEEQRP